jgi:ligand-binding sensor domain-containing protein
MNLSLTQRKKMKFICWIQFRSSVVVGLIALGCLLLISHSVHASQWRNFLPGECATAIVFDPQNRFVWIGTDNNGLWKTDGKRFEKFDMQNTGGNLPSNHINALAVDGDFIWIATNNGLTRFEPSLQQWLPFRRGNGLVSDSVSALYVDQRGILWYSTSGSGVGKFDGQSWYRYDTRMHCKWDMLRREWIDCKEYAPGEALSDNFVGEINGDSQGNKYFGTATGGLCILDSTDTTWSCLNFPTDFPYFGNRTVSAIAVDNADHKWLGTLAGICELDENNQVVRCELASPTGLLNNNVFAIWIDTFQNKWIGTDSGLSVLDSTGLRWKSFTVEDQNRGPASNRIRAITGDTDDNIWFGFLDARGISQFNNKWSSETVEDGLNDNFIFALERDGQGRFWVGNTINELQVFHQSKWQDNTPSCLNPNPFQVKTFARGQGDRVWVGTHNCGLFAMSVNGVDDVFWRDDPPNFPSNLVLSVATQQDTVLWIGTNRGLCRLSPQTRKCKTFSLDSLGLSDMVYAVALDHVGNVWAGTAKGLGKFDSKDGTLLASDFELPDSTVNALAVGMDGSVWVGTNGGISRFYKDQWTTFTNADGLPSNAITVIASNSKGFVWCGTLGGAASFNSTNNTWTPYTTDDGLSDNFITDITFAAQNVVWLSTWGGGLSRYHRTNIGPETQLLTKFDVTTDNNVTFEFTGYDLNTPANQLRYSFKLDTEEWSKPTFGTFVTKRIEEPGRHRFYVRAIDKDGNIDRSEAMLSFTKLNSGQGGRLEFLEAERVRKFGALWLYIPPNAIDPGTEIRVAPVDLSRENGLPPGSKFTGIAYQLSPEDVAIDTSKQLTMTIFYSKVSTREIGDEHKLTIFRRDEQGNWKRLGGTVDTRRQEISTSLSKLGTFGVFEDTSQTNQNRFEILSDILAQPRIFAPNGNGLSERLYVSFDLGEPAEVTAKVYHLSGRQVRILCEGRMMNAGRNAIEWNGRDYNNLICPSGLYIVAIEAAGLMKTKTVMVQK